MSVYKTDLSDVANNCWNVILAKPGRRFGLCSLKGILLNHPLEVNGSFVIDLKIKGFSKVNWLKSKWFSSDLNQQAENFDLNNWF